MSQNPKLMLDIKQAAEILQSYVVLPIEITEKLEAKRVIMYHKTMRFDAAAPSPH